MRIKVAFALLGLVADSLGGARATAAPATPIEQASWPSLKKQVELPNGMRLAYVEAGNPNGEPLLLLHGYTDTSRSWSLLVPHLSEYRLLIPDQRGHGASGAPECCYTIADFAYDARLFLDALGVKRAAVAGHSMGSMVAMAMAAEYPDRVSAIALLGSSGLVPATRGAWLFDNATGQRFPIDRNSQFMRDWDPANQPTPIDAAFAAAAREEIYAIPPQVWRGVLRELTGVLVARHSADVKARVLVLSGGKDPLFPAEHHDALLKAFPGAKARVYPGLGHNFLWEQPAAVAADLDRFLKASRGN